MFCVAYKSLNERARALGIATDLPFINRRERRENLKTAIIEESKGLGRKFKTKKRYAG